MKLIMIALRGWCLHLGLVLGLALFLVACGGGGDDERSQPLVLQPTSLTLQPGEAASVAMIQGFPPYRVVSDNPAAVQASMQERNELRVVAQPEAAAGTYQLSVSDARGSRANIGVVVNVSPLRVLVPEPLYLIPEESRLVKVAGGVPPYQAAVDRSDVVKTDMVAGGFVIQAQQVLGSANVTVTDAQGSKTALNVVVKTTKPMDLQPSALVVPVDSATVPLQIQGGAGPYRVLVSHPSAIRATVEGAIVQLTGLAQTADDVTITVIDHYGQTASAAVKVGPPVREFSIIPQSVVVSEASNQEIALVFLGKLLSVAPTVLSSNIRLLQPKSGSLSTSGVALTVQGTGACVEKDEEVDITVIASDGAIATAKVKVRNIANQYDGEDKLISRCPPASL